MTTDAEAEVTWEDLRALEWVYRRVVADFTHALTLEGAVSVERVHALAGKLAARLPPEGSVQCATREPTHTPPTNAA